MIEITYVILCGGFGARLSPLSRSGFPKQFLCLSGAKLGEDDVVRFENTYGRQ
nr:MULTISPECIES: sugar phosphate nucleotidyltransferase [unclassified Massilia]